MTKFLKNELTNDSSGGTNEDQQDNIGKIFRILIYVYNNLCEIYNSPVL